MGDPNDSIVGVRLSKEEYSRQCNGNIDIASLQVVWTDIDDIMFAKDIESIL
jgi:hypothetical protein